MNSQILLNKEIKVNYVTRDGFRVYIFPYKHTTWIPL